MIPTKRPRVKICCIGAVDEAWMAIRYGASALGLVSEMPSGPGVIPEDLIATIAARVPPPVATFLLTSKRQSAEIVAQQRRTGVKTIQIVDRVEPDCYANLRRALPGISLVQVVHVTGPEAIERAVSVAPHVDAVFARQRESDSAGQGTRRHRTHARLGDQRPGTRAAGGPGLPGGRLDSRERATSHHGGRPLRG